MIPANGRSPQFLSTWTSRQGCFEHPFLQCPTSYTPQCGRDLHKGEKSQVVGLLGAVWDGDTLLIFILQVIIETEAGRAHPECSLDLL